MRTPAFIAALALLAASPLSADIGKLSAIIDGDTVYFGEVHCRLAYIDTPESKNNDKARRDAGQCTGMTPDRIVGAGKAASDFTRSQLQLGKSYKFEVVDTDRYGRSVCLIEANGGSLNLGIVAAGYAVAFDRYIPDGQTKQLFNKYEQSAKRNGQGLWGSHRNVLECMSQ